MGFFEQFGIGIKSYVKAIALVFNNNLWVYFIYPLVISVLLFLSGFSIVHSLADFIEKWVLSFINPENSSTSGMQYISGFLHSFLNIGLKIMFYFVFSAFSKYILLIVMSPIMSLLSERTEKILTGKKYSFNAAQFLKDIIRGIGIALRNMAIEFSLIILCFLIVWVPIIGWLSPIFLLMVSYYFYGFSMMDYVSERRKLNISESVQFIRRNKGLAMGNGFIFSLLFAIPIIGAMFAAILAPVAASISVLEIDK